MYESKYFAYHTQQAFTFAHAYNEIGKHILRERERESKDGAVKNPVFDYGGKEGTPCAAEYRGVVCT